MEKAQRTALANAIVEARFVLEDEFQEQLTGVYNIREDGTITEEAPGDPIIRAKLMGLVEHFNASEVSAAAAVARARRELAFTTLNRFVALKLAEARGIVRECVSSGVDSIGITELADCAPGLRAACDDGGYRVLLESVMDEISLEVGILFDRRSPAGILWPRPNALRQLLAILSDESLATVWESDETIGWIYQYFNADDVEEMRQASRQPRNSRELAVRNQFFTPEYIVRFLTDNTLGRLWYDLTGGKTDLAESCTHLIYSPSNFEAAKQSSHSGGFRGSFQQPDPGFRDPREIRLLDPACGSGHFLVYAFGVLQAIYEEAWRLRSSSASSPTALREDYPTFQDLQAATPALILHHNLFGIEIDSRCSQIASLALWLRAQRAWSEMQLPVDERPRITHTNIVVAEPIAANEGLLDSFREGLDPPILGDLLEELVKELSMAGELGSLLKIEESIDRIIDNARDSTRQGTMFGLRSAPEEFWESAEKQLLHALRSFAGEALPPAGQSRRKMFVNDAEQGVALVDVLRSRYDVVVMNPPFGDPTPATKDTIRALYPVSKQDLYASFVERGLELLRPNGLLGAITSRTGFYLSTYRKWREEILLEKSEMRCFADLGYGIMDNAKVEAAAYCLEKK